jgi:hypothetical protein
MNAMPFSGSVVAATMASNIAATIAAQKRVGNSDELPTIVIERPPKESLIKGIDNERIGSGSLHFPLWIKVPWTISCLAASSRRYFLR